ncbi:hypothetical protein BZL30_4668 [Mycobacterium kansasii]|uniref:Uncharacterized protein n=1 Tax=Mycobacterium kansasii TaxID=1768 RepID=A0A1V3X485_MYCKA|nr:hypothetical protein BZL30_4668 [Mycobacterium kansasii]
MSGRPCPPSTRLGKTAGLTSWIRCYAAYILRSTSPRTQHRGSVTVTVPSPWASQRHLASTNEMAQHRSIASFDPWLDQSGVCSSSRSPGRARNHHRARSNSQRDAHSHVGG